MTELICFIGCIGSGKDYQAKKLVKKGYTQINFADSLREMAWDILGWTPANEEEYEAFKNYSIFLNPSFFTTPNRDSGHMLIGSCTAFTGRQFLQNLGSTLRKRDSYFWVALWADKVYSNLPQNAVCSDLRYSNELKAACIFDITVKFIFCDYKSDRYNCTDTDKTEKLAQRILADGYNDGDELPEGYIRKLIMEEN